jgi:hypothetical protein
MILVLDMLARVRWLSDGCEVPLTLSCSRLGTGSLTVEGDDASLSSDGTGRLEEEDAKREEGCDGREIGIGGMVAMEPRGSC